MAHRTYELDIISQQTTTYSVSIFARSKELLERNNLQSYRSETALNKIVIRRGARDIVLLRYSRDPTAKVTAQRQLPLNANEHNTDTDSQADETARTK
jgi:hypothetical protein